jgi:hypothetical protein
MGRRRASGLSPNSLVREAVADTAPASRRDRIAPLAATHLQFGEFYIAGPHRRNGRGTAVLADALRQADLRQLETRLEYLKWNPVGSLYGRHGFRIVRETDSHYFLVLTPMRRDGASA